ncbi:MULTISPECIES: restriction endonuclease subunit S [Vibrio]|uniref:restriction endonuclease subunit S n=1 Tax=Vibrio TaxID=662 RepID=UPI0006190CC4|nr:MULTISPECIES: restriction endonuclease subunit S [Vibrio]QCI70005.1 restriction endonuclease subunit S [Vibrio cyclitrophicus]
MNLEKKVPEIRFHGFSRDWQNKEIGSTLGETKRPVELLDNELYQLVTVKRRNEGVVPRAILKGKDILVKNYYGIKAGDYLISKRQVVHGANGIVPESLDNAVVSNEYLVLTDTDETTAKFWTVISKRPEMHKLFFISSYGVDIEKLVFDVSDWKSRTITIPDLAEQNAITAHFQKLDSLINQHQQKHDKLSNIKKAMLEKMFPKQGETLPEIRFKGFSGEWEEKVLEDICDVRDGTHASPKYQQNGFPLVTSKNVKNGYINYDDVQYISKIDFDEINKRSKVDVNDILIGMIGTIGNIALIRQTPDFAIKNVALIKDKNEMDFLYSYYFLQSPITTQQLDDFASGGTQKFISLSNVRSLLICVPEREEQTAIGNYFQKLDTLINQHQQQINKLNNIKQACLSKMFV